MSVVDGWIDGCMSVKFSAGNWVREVLVLICEFSLEGRPLV